MNPVVDQVLARDLHRKLNGVGVTENAIFNGNVDKENYEPRTLVDRTLELIDPTPNIYTLFIQFNERFFWNKLLPVEVRWSPRMTSCAGICSFHPRNKQCVIALSAPLLKLRPRKDLVETLLHEMIHGYLFLTNNDRDRDGHGPQFCKHMNRINQEAGTNITIYHSFHEEVKLYQQHWWRCDGPCQHKAPYFGTVRRSMNRAPGRNDFWWNEHQLTCGGKFIKVREPEKPKIKGKKINSKDSKSSTPEGKKLSNWLIKTDTTDKRVTPPTEMRPPVTSLQTRNETGNIHDINRTKNKTDYPDKSKGIPPAGIMKIGSNANKVFGWGTGGPNGCRDSKPTNLSTIKPIGNSTPKSDSKSTPKLLFSGVVGGSGTGKSNLVDKYSENSHLNHVNQKLLHESRKGLKSPLRTASSLSSTEVPNKKLKVNVEKDNENVNCPVCNMRFAVAKLNKHLDECLSICDTESYATPDTSCQISTSSNCLPSSSCSSSVIIIDDSDTTDRHKGSHESQSDSRQFKTNDNPDSESAVNCPTCNVPVLSAKINEHLDECLTNLMLTQECIQDDKPDNIDRSSLTLGVFMETDSPNSINLISLDESSVSDSVLSGKEESLTISSKMYKCLVCNSIIESTVPLKDHLEDCVASVFNDESSSFTDFNTKDKSAEQVAKFPCPICMEVIWEKEMNHHLDGCLTKNV
ncbi:sprT-like domain-containing protein Spartan [Orussus abietinus]|uniref:sprT-like domain-containing protein Spartan n=1 Tax=Orussus abietinus TaxID=222816 RepID=UPI0006253DCD|nr:sprT-like domain-containing protein Spartan [Orussus abietinus]